MKFPASSVLFLTEWCYQYVKFKNTHLGDHSVLLKHGPEGLISGLPWWTAYEDFFVYLLDSAK